MKKNKYQIKKRNYLFKKNLLFPIILTFSCLFLCIGYASINNIALEFNGISYAKSQNGLFIYDIKIIEDAEQNASASIMSYKKMMMNSSITLEEKKNSSITLEIETYNNSSTIHIFEDTTPNQYDEDFYSNKYITYEIDSRLKPGDLIEPYERHTFSITFKYIDELDFNNLPEDFTNTLSSCINFNFLFSQNISIGNNLLDSSTNVANTYIGENGQLISYDGWSTSDYIYIGNYKKLIIIIENNIKSNNWNATYDENYNFVRRINITNTRVTNNEIGGAYLGFYIMDVNSNEKYLRLSNTNSLMSQTKIYPITDDSFNGRFDDYISFMSFSNFGDNIYNINNNVLNSYINSSNGSQIGYTGWQSSEYIDISNYEKIAISSKVSSNFLTQWNAFYDQNKKFVKSFSGSSVVKNYSNDLGYYMIVNLSSQYHYLRISETNKNMANIQIYPILKNESTEIIPSNLKVGKNIYNYEDSIKNTYIGNQGTEISYNGWSSSDFLYIGDYDKWIITGDRTFLTDWNALYNDNKTFLKTLNCSKAKLYNKTIDNHMANICYLERETNVKYLRLSAENNTMRYTKIYPILNNDFNGIISFDIE